MQRLDAPSLRPDCPERHRERVNDLMYLSIGRRKPYALTSHMQRLLPRCHAALAVIEAVRCGAGRQIGFLALASQRAEEFRKPLWHLWRVRRACAAVDGVLRPAGDHVLVRQPSGRLRLGLSGQGTQEGVITPQPPCSAHRPGNPP